LVGRVKGRHVYKTATKYVPVGKNSEAWKELKIYNYLSKRPWRAVPLKNLPSPKPGWRFGQDSSNKDHKSSRQRIHRGEKRKLSPRLGI